MESSRRSFFSFLAAAVAAITGRKAMADANYVPPNQPAILHGDNVLPPALVPKPLSFVTTHRLRAGGMWDRVEFENIRPSDVFRSDYTEGDSSASYYPDDKPIERPLRNSYTAVCKTAPVPVPALGNWELSAEVVKNDDCKTIIRDSREFDVATGWIIIRHLHNGEIATGWAPFGEGTPTTPVLEGA